MRRPALIGSALLAVLSTTGCGEIVASAAPQPLAAFASGRQEETAVWAYHPSLGFVRGTRPVLALLGGPLEPAQGPNRTVEACRAATWAEAVKLGGYTIEAVSAGPERVGKAGQVVGPVRLRITYQKVTGTYRIYEVREATLTCVVGRDGTFINATHTEPGPG